MFVPYILDSDVLPPATELPEGTDISHTVRYCMSWEKILFLQGSVTAPKHCLFKWSCEAKWNHLNTLSFNHTNTYIAHPVKLLTLVVLHGTHILPHKSTRLETLNRPETPSTIWIMLSWGSAKPFDCYMSLICTLFFQKLSTSLWATLPWQWVKLLDTRCNLYFAVMSILSVRALPRLQVA